MFVDVRPAACLISTNLTRMIFYLQMNAFYMLSQRTRAKTFIGADVAGEVTNLEMNATNMSQQIAIL